MGRAFERLHTMELEMHIAAVADRDSAVAAIRRSQEGLRTARTDLGSADASARAGAALRQRAEHAPARPHPCEPRLFRQHRRSTKLLWSPREESAQTL